MCLYGSVYENIIVVRCFFCCFDILMRYKKTNRNGMDKVREKEGLSKQKVRYNKMNND